MKFYTYDYSTNIVFSCKDKKVIKEKIYLHVFARRLSDTDWLESNYSYIGTIGKEWSPTFWALPDTYEVLFVGIEKKKGKTYIAWSSKRTYTITQGKQTINLTL